MNATKNISQENSIRDEWFGDMLHHLSSDRDFINMGIASAETKQFYDSLIFGDQTKLHLQFRELTSRSFIRKLVIDYFQELKEANVNPLKLFLDHNDAQLFVWAEIEDDDDRTELALFEAEAKANAKNYQYGFSISSTILEKSDGLEVPPHYQTVQKI